MLSDRFEEWHSAMFKNDPNHNGIYNGINLTGLNIARLYLALRKNPALTIPQFLEGEEVFYKVRLPHSKHFELPKRYPWMLKNGEQPHAGHHGRAAEERLDLKFHAARDEEDRDEEAEADGHRRP